MSEKKPSILSIRISSEYGVAAMGVTKLWSMYFISKLRCIYCLADMNFLEDMIDLLLNRFCLFFFLCCCCFVFCFLFFSLSPNTILQNGFHPQANAANFDSCIHLSPAYCVLSESTVCPVECLLKCLAYYF